MPELWCSVCRRRSGPDCPLTLHPLMPGGEGLVVCDDCRLLVLLCAARGSLAEQPAAELAKQDGAYRNLLTRLHGLGIDAGVQVDADHDGGRLTGGSIRLVGTEGR